MSLLQKPQYRKILYIPGLQALHSSGSSSAFSSVSCMHANGMLRMFAKSVFMYEAAFEIRNGRPGLLLLLLGAIAEGLSSIITVPL